MVQFVLAQRIDPNNTFHLIKLWGCFDNNWMTSRIDFA